MLGYIQQVSSSSVSIQTWSSPASLLGKCLYLIMGMRCGSLLDFPLCTPPERMRSVGNLPHSPTSDVFNREMWAIFAGAVSICCSLLVAHWARDSWASMSLSLSNRWPSVQSSTPNLGCLGLFPRAPFEKLKFVSHPQHPPFRTFVLLHPFPLVPQTCASGCWNPVPA